MNPTLIKAVVVVTCALLFYSVAVITEQRKSLISKSLLFFLTGGVCLDIGATVLMIIGSGKLPLTVPQDSVIRSPTATSLATLLSSP